MKTNLRSMPSIVQLEVDVLNNLVKEVQETVATGVNMPAQAKATLKVVDLWNIQRNMKSATRYSRRRAF